MLYTLIPYPICYIILENYFIQKHYSDFNWGNIGIIQLVAALNNSCSDQPKMNVLLENTNNINGTYISESDGFESSITIIGSYWFATNKENNFEIYFHLEVALLMATEFMMNMVLELGYISNSSVYLNIGGYQLTLDKE